jgi:hypothetical protein
VAKNLRDVSDRVRTGFSQSEEKLVADGFFQQSAPSDVVPEAGVSPKRAGIGEVIMRVKKIAIPIGLERGGMAPARLIDKIVVRVNHEGPCGCCGGLHDLSQCIPSEDVACPQGQNPDSATRVGNCIPCQAPVYMSLRVEAFKSTSASLERALGQIYLNHCRGRGVSGKDNPFGKLPAAFDLGSLNRVKEQFV